ncbi:hypothetical protein GCM10010495_46790 [Kitasatospora herbaricolor]|uniref:DUF5304 family protein n=1 Tax=Kitasatospora herbaricolor TaxID=68217 RepID=UPI00174BB7D4|nr:DUF5304 family protein [Kitasatospora herbaricolor]MDQ0307858.1 hypothetical protein [Kitasatospora herbaricolor]GGV25667.1 hypothetical protein GCM10010495_46790 [Kitasatospora herbaricolor]
MTTADDRTGRPADESAESTRPGDGRPGDGTEAGPGRGERQDAGTEHPFGPELGLLVEEVRRLAKAVGEKAEEAGVPQFAAAALGSLGSLAPGGAAGSLGTLSELPGVLRAKHPEVYGHLAAAGGELLAAYRAAVSGHERRWSSGGGAHSEHIDLDTPDGPSDKE